MGTLDDREIAELKAVEKYGKLFYIWHNGGGLVLAKCIKNINKDVFVYGGGTIYGGTIWGGTIYGGTIYGGEIRRGEIKSNQSFIQLYGLGNH